MFVYVYIYIINHLHSFTFIYTHLHSFTNRDLEAASLYLPPGIFQNTKKLNMLSFNAILQNLDQNLLSSLDDLYWLYVILIIFV